MSKRDQNTTNCFAKKWHWVRSTIEYGRVSRKQFLTERRRYLNEKRPLFKKSKPRRYDNLANIKSVWIIKTQLKLRQDLSLSSEERRFVPASPTSQVWFYCKCTWLLFSGFWTDIYRKFIFLYDFFPLTKNKNKSIRDWMQDGIKGFKEEILMQHDQFTS